MITIESVFSQPLSNGMKFDLEFFRKLNSFPVSSPMNEKKEHILRHTLGLDRKSVPYRNHYSAHRLSESHLILLEMEKEGLVRETQRTGEYFYYTVTGKGKEAIGARSDWDEYSDDELLEEVRKRGLEIDGNEFELDDEDEA